MIAVFPKCAFSVFPLLVILSSSTCRPLSALRNNLSAVPVVDEEMDVVKRSHMVVALSGSLQSSGMISLAEMLHIHQPPPGLGIGAAEFLCRFNPFLDHYLSIGYCLLIREYVMTATKAFLKS
jgi:hypothetical protein